MEKQPVISVLVPIFRVENYLARCLDSILEQNFTEFEVVLVNDASPDNSARIAAEYAARDCRIRILHHERNLGLMAARRTGYQHVRGKYIIFCDSDDFLPPNALAALYQKIEETQADIVFGDYVFINSRGKHTYRRHSRIPCRTVDDVQKALLLQQMFCSLCCSIFKSSLFSNYSYTSLPDITVSEDRMLLIQILCNTTSIAFLEKNTYFYCQNQSSSTRTRMNITQLKNTLNCYCWIYDFLIRFDIYPELTRRYLLRVVDSLLEQGYEQEVLLMPKTLKELYTFSNHRKLLGWRIAIHAELLKLSRFYRWSCRTVRLKIQRLQGKS